LKQHVSYKLIECAILVTSVERQPFALIDFYKDHFALMIIYKMRRVLWRLFNIGFALFHIFN